MPTAIAALSLTLLAASAGSMTVPATEKEALVEIYRATGGEQWDDHGGWLVDADPCQWSGVLCGADDTAPGFTVVGLLLPMNKLRGTFPFSVLTTKLPNLRTLDIRWSGLEGEVPEVYLERWDRNEFELSLAGNRFSNLVTKVRIEFSASGVRCAFDDDVRYVVEIDEGGRAHFESVRCAKTKEYCLVRDGEGPSLARLSRVLKRIDFDNLAGSYSYPFTFATHQVYVTTTVWYGDGRSHAVETYGGQGPIEAYIAEQTVFGLVHQIRWKSEKRMPRCTAR